MKIIKLLLPFIFMFLLAGHILTIWGIIIGEPCKKYNEHKEGAKILERRTELLNGKLPENYDVFFLGTSRTMQEIDADLIASHISSKLNLPRKLKAYNLGNLGQDVAYIDRVLKGSTRPKVLIIEDEVGTFTLTNRNTQTLFKKYEADRKIAEMKFAGMLYDLSGVKLYFKIGESSVYGFLKALIGNSVSNKDLYYYHLCAAASGQILMKDGQVLTLTQIPNRDAAQSCKMFYNERSWFGMGTKLPLEENPMWETLKKIIDPYVKSNRIVVIKPPVDPKFLQLQLQYNNEVHKKALSYFLSVGIPYINFNPNDYYSTDYSHIDWYETQRFSIDLADKIIPLIDWKSISAE